MQIGKLNKMITLQYPTRAPDGQGSFTDSYTDAATVWAAIWPVSANAQVKSGQMTGTITHRIRIRSRRVLLSSWRIKFGNRYFNIVGPPINPDESNQWLDLMCEESE